MPLFTISSHSAVEQFLNLFDYETHASQYLSPMAWDYYVSGAWDEVTLRDNRDAFNRIKLRPRMLVDVSQRDLRVTVLGRSLSMPILVAPMAFQGLAHPQAELATAKAAAEAGTVMVLSTLSNKRLEDVAAVGQETVNSASNSSSNSDGNHGKQPGQWFQLYVHRDRGLTKALVERAYATGYTALCVTVDAPMLGQRERDRHNRFTLPAGLELANLTNLSHLDLPHPTEESGLFAYFIEQINPALTWADLEWLQSLSPLPLVVKGILRGDDAQRALAHGASAIIVSNHGGRQLDSAIATIEALEDVVQIVAGQCDVLIDGGIRRGTDVLKALALGATAVLIGRPILWGLAVAGAPGVQHVLELLRRELDLAMALSGCARLKDIDASLCTAQLR